MKRLRQLCAATILTILLTNFAWADEGIMHPNYAPTPTPVGKVSSDLDTTCEVVEPDSEESATDLATEITLQLVQSILVLF